MKDYLAEIVAERSPRDAVHVMREYLQSRVLTSLQDQGAWASLAFMGGTALRFLYRLPRFSEDLDFSLENRSAGYDFVRLMQTVGADLQRENYAIDVELAARSTVNKAFVRFQGLEYDLGLSPHTDKVFSVKVEVDTNPPEGAGLASTTVRRFGTLRLTHHDKQSLVAGKIAAVVLREWLKGRDVYDLVWYLSDATWPEPNEVLLCNAMLQGNRPDLAGADQAWRSALVSRLRSAPWDHVLTDVERFLERPEERWMVERETVLGVLGGRGWTA